MAIFEITQTNKIVVKDKDSGALFSLEAGANSKGQQTLRLSVYNKGGQVSGNTLLFRETFLDAIVKLWPDNVAYQFPEDE